MACDDRRFSIRPYMAGDAEQMAVVFYRSVRELAVSDYTRDQVEAWAPELPDADPFAVRAADGRLTLVAVDASGRVVGYADLENDGHIDHLYIHPDAAGVGVATMLYQALEDSAERAGLHMMFVEASELARRFFVKQGFSVLARRDFQRSGVEIHNYSMEKPLTNPRVPSSPVR